MSRSATQALLKSDTEAPEPRETESSPVIDFMSFASKNWLHWDGISSQMEKVGFPAIINSDAIAAANKETVDAVVQSAAALTKGMEEIGRYALSVMKNSSEANLETIKAASTIKTPQELFGIQSEWANRFVSLAIEETGKFSALSIKVSCETAELFYAHINGICGKIGKRD